MYTAVMTFLIVALSACAVLFIYDTIGLRRLKKHSSQS